MDWYNERYVRVYCRDTLDWLAWPWQARAVLPLLMRKLDRSGTIELGRHGANGLAAAIGLPAEVAEPGLAALLEDGCLQQTGTTLVMPNFLEAQEATASDAKRAKDYRERRRSDAVTKRDANVTHSKAEIWSEIGGVGQCTTNANKRNDQTWPESSRNVTDESRNVTQTSRVVTDRHAASRGVTPSVPSVLSVQEDHAGADAPHADVPSEPPTPKPKPSPKPRTPSFAEAFVEKLQAARLAKIPDALPAPVKPQQANKLLSAGARLGQELRARGESVFLAAFERFLADSWWRSKGCPVSGFLSDSQWPKYLTQVPAAPPADGRLENGCRLLTTPEDFASLYPDAHDNAPPVKSHG